MARYLTFEQCLSFYKPVVSSPVELMQETRNYGGYGQSGQYIMQQVFRLGQTGQRSRI